MAVAAFTLNRAEVVDRNFISFCQELERSRGPQVEAAGAGAPGAAAAVGERRHPDEPLRPDLPQLTGRVLRELLESQFVSRHLDLMARELRRQGRGYYTIGSAGHEGNVVLGRFVRFSDPAFLHYRSGALMAERSRQRPGEEFIRDTLLSLMASKRDPIAGGRHKVWGSVRLCVPPQTSTIASHLPRAVGAALALERARRLGVPASFGAFGQLPEDSIILCTFGDATVNHSVAQGAFNACCYAAFQNLPVPILLVCEDNGIGISVHTAPQWIETAFAQRPALRYFACDGLDLVDATRAALQAVEYVRRTRRPAFLHMKVVRLLGHAGTDPETEYHTLAQIQAAEARDPLLGSARLAVESGCMSAAEVLELYESVRARVRSEADGLGTPPQLGSAAEIMEPLAPCHPQPVMTEATRPPPGPSRLHAFALDSTPGFVRDGTGPRLPEFQPPRHMAVLINWALRDLLAKYPQMLIFGEDVAARGGVYYVTAGLTARFGVGRVFNTLLDETTILGMAIGAGHLGLLAFPEIQYLAYVHNAIDQLRGEACSSQFFSRGQFPTPMVVRIQSLAYQKGFGGHFHNDNSIAALRDIPSLVVACPCRGDDAVRMLRTAAALARVDGRVVAFLEPIALYMTRDLYATGDGLWLSKYPPPGEAIAPGQGRVYHADGRVWDGPAAPLAPTRTACRHACGPGADDPATGSAGDGDDGRAGAVREHLTVLTFGNGVPMSLRAARTLREQHGVHARVVDLRWLSPLNERFILGQSLASGRVLVVDEGRYSGGIAEAVLALLMERAGGRVVAARVTGLDAYIPLGPPADLVLPGEADIVHAALDLCERDRPDRARRARRRAARRGP